MRKVILFLMFFAFFILDLEIAQATTFYSSIGKSNFNRCKYGHRHNHNLNPFNRFNRGVVTGFSPPVNYGNYQKRYYNSNPFVLNNSFGLANKIKRIFRSNNNFDPFSNTYNYPLQSQNQIQLFDSGQNNSYGFYDNGDGFNFNNSSNGGVGVTIIE